MPALTPRQLSTQKAINRAGRTIQLIPNAVDASGVEKSMEGDETGIVAVKAIFKERGFPFSEGVLDAARRGDVEGGATMERTVMVAFAALSFEPDIDTRVLDGGKTYSVLKVTPNYHGEDILSYKLVIRPL